MKRILFIISLALALAFCVASSGTWVTTAHAKAPPVVCGGPCDGGGYVCDANHAGQPGANGGYCHQEALPSWPYYRWTF